MRALIVGGCGFVGLNIAEALLRRGDDAVLFDANPLHPVAEAAFQALPGGFTVQLGDVRDPASVAAAFADHEIDAVFYGAAMTSGPEREREAPAQVLQVNLLGLVNVIKAAAAAGGVGRIINIGSGSAYGRHRQEGKGVVLEEVTPSEPESLYGISKLATEAVSRRLAGLLELDIRSVRLAAVYGPWEIDSGARDTLSPLMQAGLSALRGERVLLPRRDRQDWVYSRDVATALSALADAPAPSHDQYHIASATPCGVIDWCAVLARHYPDFHYALAKPGEAATINLHGDQDRRSLSGARLTADIGHTLPSDPEAAFVDFVEWMAQHGAFWKK
ncbi:MAG: NAD(P)-dependent oxidoreductase [Rhodospirillaceae bacterium]|jgi:nucleoside-diphosphate-sugar epimerase|nr:NAD(P)-dependent oxidoreductase [Rhodospirillaceae bacterium]MBT3491907.1 NAD(P)-dependent oxidoreductase [Rhodospirillaceae bacterium]MBT3780211.1 NAD(P)-dependent oxidoreductase [Rhodospirillaceae bacterium]MBT3978033.1 NAD(P)-dependent oxidoreductase [Rhodospirillaceae bacterium]MBT4168863.1 NAD(P)-dependent oxidoreductase [Rhodospirillaceae bacterium]